MFFLSQPCLRVFVCRACVFTSTKAERALVAGGHQTQRKREVGDTTRAALQTLASASVLLCAVAATPPTNLSTQQHTCEPSRPPRASRPRARAAPPPPRPRAPPPAVLPPLPPALTTALTSPSPGLAVGIAANTAVFVTGARVLSAGLTPAAVAHAWLLGTLVFSAFGARGYALVCAYFIAGSAATRVGLAGKQAAGIAEARGGRRAPASVYGSGAAAMAAAVGALAAPTAAPWTIAFVASIASKLADTASSEIGKAMGKTTYLISTLRRVPPGTEGAVSAEGTAAGVVAAALFTGAAVAARVVSPSGAAIAIAAAVVANVFESWLGAVEQGKVAWLTNDAVNVVQTCVAAVLAAGVAAQRGIVF